MFKSTGHQNLSKTNIYVKLGTVTYQIILCTKKLCLDCDYEEFLRYLSLNLKYNYITFKIVELFNLVFSFINVFFCFEEPENEKIQLTYCS